MAIRFLCQQCGQLLGIARRKAGTQIDCPKCGQAQTVPTEEEAAAALAARSAGAKGNEESSGIVVYDEEPAEESPADELPSPAPQPVPVAVPTAEEPDTRPLVSVALRPVPAGMVLLSRRTLYVQAVVILAAGVGGFAGGYFIGRGDATLEEQARREQAEKTPVMIEGRLFYRTDAAAPVADDGAVAIVLPAARKPERRFSAFGIRPHDPVPRPTDKTLQAIAELGGAYARADESGRFWMQTPDQGEYFLLLISRRTGRPKGAEVEELTAEQMQGYFAIPRDLLGRSKFRWTLENVARGMKPVEYDFGRDGE